MNARDVALERLCNEVRRFPDLDLAPLETSGLDARDAALALAIDQAVRRQWLTLVCVIESQLTRPWHETESKLQAVLLAGSAQLLFLDRLPDHAVIHEAVEWAKRSVRPKAGGLVNAVLRRIAALRGEQIASSSGDSWSRSQLPRGDGRVFNLTEPVFADTPVTRLAQQTSHPETLIARWMHALGETATRQLAAHSLVQPPIIVSGVEGRTDAADAELLPHASAGFQVFSGTNESLRRLLRTHPNLIVHDPTSAAPVIAVATMSLAPKLIIDACAGKGTKTRLLARLFPSAKIVATDIDAGLMSALREQFAGSEQVQIVEHSELVEHCQQADLLVLDVPCSNTGVLARRVEAKYRFSAKSLDQLVALQRQIIADSIPLLASGGSILYATCSVDEAENQQQAQWLAKWHRMRIARQESTLPHGLPGDPPTLYRDGGYWALLQR